MSLLRNWGNDLEKILNICCPVHSLSVLRNTWAGGLPLKNSAGVTKTNINPILWIRPPRNHRVPRWEVGNVRISAGPEQKKPRNSYNSMRFTSIEKLSGPNSGREKGLSTTGSSGSIRSKINLALDTNWIVMLQAWTVRPPIRFRPIVLLLFFNLSG